MIEVEGLSKAYGARTVLAGVSVAFEPGQVVSLIGPSGGGKSTLLRCLNGLESFDGGSITIVGERLVPGGPRVNARPLAAIRRKVGMVFQQWNLFAHRTAIGNIIEAPVHVKGVPVAEATERARSLLERVGLSHRADAYPHEMRFAREVSDRVLVLHGGAVIEDGPPAEVLDRPQHERTRAFLGLGRPARGGPGSNL